MNNDENDNSVHKNEILRSSSKIRLPTKRNSIHKNSRHLSLNSKSKKKCQDDINQNTYRTPSPKDRLLRKRRTSINFGSPLPSPNVSVERYYNIIGLIGECVMLFI